MGPVEPDGYVVDFLVLKKIAEEECQQLHFTTLLPEHSDCLHIEANIETVRVTCEDGTHFSFPRQDVCLLPIVHSSSEEIAQYLLARLRVRLDSDLIKSRHARCRAMRGGGAPGAEYHKL